MYYDYEYNIGLINYYLQWLKNLCEKWNNYFSSLSITISIIHSFHSLRTFRDYYHVKYFECSNTVMKITLGECFHTEVFV